MFTKIRAGLLAASLVTASLAVPTAAIGQEAETPPPATQGRFQGVIMETITELLGVSRGDVISEIRTGGTIAELAAAYGSSGDLVVGALMDRVDDRLAGAVEAEKIDQAEADAKRADALERISALVFDVRERRDGARNPGIGNGEARQLLIDTVQAALNINQGELVSYVRAGGTLAELAEENGLSGPELEVVLIEAASVRISQAVADGLIDETRATELLDKAASKIAELVYQVRQPGNGQEVSARE